MLERLGIAASDSDRFVVMWRLAKELMAELPPVPADVATDGTVGVDVADALVAGLRSQLVPLVSAHEELPVSTCDRAWRGCVPDAPSRLCRLGY